MASFGYDTAGSLGKLADYRQRRVLNGGIFEITGGTQAGGQNFTVASTGGTFRYTPTGQLLTLSGNINSDIQIDGNLTFDSIGNVTVTELMAGAGGLTKTGGGTLLLNNVANPFSGNITVGAGTLQTGLTAGGGTNGYLGVVNGTRAITVNSGTSLVMQGNNNFGGVGKTAASIPSVTVNGGALNALRFNILGNLSLNGGALSQSSTDTGTYEGWQFIGSINVGGSSPSTISSGNGKANHLLGVATTTFAIADATGDNAADLIISNALRNGSNDHPGIGSLRKEGPGTLLLAGTNTYTGSTTVAAGTLAVTGTLANSATTIDSGATLGGTGTLAGMVTVNGFLTPGFNNIETLTINNALVLNGTAEMEINKSGTTLAADKLQGMTALTYGGTLKVTATGDALATGDTFVLFTMASGTATGTFATIDLPTLPGTLQWDNSLLASSGSISVVGPPTPLQSWRKLHFNTSANTGDAANNADPGSDGLSNLLEYALNLDPKSAGTTAANVTTNTTGGYLRLTVVKNPAATDLTYQIQVTADLSDWKGAEGIDVVTEENTSSSLVVRDNTPVNVAAARFIRLRVISTAQP